MTRLLESVFYKQSRQYSILVSWDRIHKTLRLQPDILANNSKASLMRHGYQTVPLPKVA